MLLTVNCLGVASTVYQLGQFLWSVPKMLNTKESSFYTVDINFFGLSHLLSPVLRSIFMLPKNDFALIPTAYTSNE